MRNVVGSRLAASGLSLCLTLSGCGAPSPSGSQPYVPAAYAPTQTATRSATPGAVPVSTPPTRVIRRFIGIPMPLNNRLDVDRTVVVGGGNDWLGRIFFSAPMSVEQTIDFYRHDMPRYGWTELAVTQSDTSVLAYQMGNRMATIELTPRPAVGATQVEFWVNPLPARTGEPATRPALEPFPSSTAAVPAAPARAPIDGTPTAYPGALRAVDEAPLPPPGSPYR